METRQLDTGIFNLIDEIFNWIDDFFFALIVLLSLYAFIRYRMRNTRRNYWNDDEVITFLTHPSLNISSLAPLLSLSSSLSLTHTLSLSLSLTLSPCSLSSLTLTLVTLCLSHSHSLSPPFTLLPSSLPFLSHTRAHSLSSSHCCTLTHSRTPHSLFHPLSTLSYTLTLMHSQPFSAPSLTHSHPHTPTLTLSHSHTLSPPHSHSQSHTLTLTHSHTLSHPVLYTHSSYSLSLTLSQPLALSFTLSHLSHTLSLSHSLILSAVRCLTLTCSSKLSLLPCLCVYASVLLSLLWCCSWIHPGNHAVWSGPDGDKTYLYLRSACWINTYS